MSGSIPENVIAEVSQRVNPVEVIGRYVRLRPAGNKYLGLCPFHKEKTPSMNVDPDSGLWYCFGCHEGGNLFQFVQRMEGVGYMDAVRQLAGEVGITIEVSEAARQENSERLRALNLLDRAADFYHSVLLERPEGEMGREYMIERNIWRDTAVAFRLGWAPDGGEALLRTLHNAGFTTEEAKKCGLITENSYYGVSDIMRNRLIFPICDPQGKVLAFGGRSLGDAKAKYMNTPETPWYSKRNTLYGLNQAKLAIKSRDVCVLVEGYFDVISLHQAGITTAIASCGTALTLEQAQILKRYSNNALLMYDSDLAGQKAALSGNDILEEAGLRAQIVCLPDGEDPDSLAQQGADVVNAVLQKAEGVVPYVMEKLRRDIDITTPEGKEDFVKRIMPFLKRVKDPTRQDAYIRKVSFYCGIHEGRLHRRLLGRNVVQADPTYKVRRLTIEEDLFCICMATPSWIPLVRDIVSLDMLEDEGLHPFFAALFAFTPDVERSGSLTLQELGVSFDDKDLQIRLAELLTRKKLDTTEEDVRKLSSAVRDKQLRKRLEELRLQVIPAIDAGTLNADDPIYQEYSELIQHFHC